MTIDTSNLFWQIPTCVLCLVLIYLTNKGKGNLIFSILFLVPIVTAAISATMLYVKIRHHNFDFKPAFFTCLLSALFFFVIAWIREGLKIKLFDGIISDSWRKKYFIGYCDSPACKRKDPIKIKMGRRENVSDLRVYCPDCKREVRGKIYRY